MTSDSQITQLLAEANRGDAEALDALLEAVYRELNVMADRRIRAQREEGKPVTLDPTALVHETYLQSGSSNWPSSGANFATVATSSRSRPES